MKYIAPALLSLIAATACAQSEQDAAARAVENLAQINITATTGTQRITATITGCSVAIDTTATSGEHAGQLDHRDAFTLGTVVFRSEGTDPPVYVVALIPGETVADDPNTLIHVGYDGVNSDSITRSVPVWKNPREPYTQGPTINGVDYVLALRSRGSFILDSHEQIAPANAFVSALMAYQTQYCVAGLS